MNEIQLLRTELATERAHVSAVANACASALGGAAGAPAAGSPLAQFLQASVEYLVCVLAWFEERDQRLTDLARALPEAPERSALEEALARPGRSREALAKLEAACARSVAPVAGPASAAGDAAQRRWQEFAQYFNGTWSVRRDALEALLAGNPRPGDWRAVCGIDADSILEERRRYAQVYARLPPGTMLAPAPAPGD
jgi:hypothetical protein